MTQSAITPSWFVARSCFVLSAAALFLTTGCTSQQWYQGGQQHKCQQFHQNEDPYYQRQCQEGDFEEYERQRQAVIEGSMTSSSQSSTSN